MGPVIGIDLGTTNTVVALVREGQALAVADETGRTLIPSVVSFHPNGSVLVGEQAKARRVVDAKNTIYSIKRLIGRSCDSDEVKRARARFPFEMREGPGQAALVVARGEAYTLPEISAFVLRKAKSIAEAYLETSVERAVITVPANFNDLQRAATKVAGRVAGLEVLRILNEPTAAALAYGFGKASSERLAVYDFGGGTFDITLLDLTDNVFEVLATAGNTFLGGDDIDLAIADRMASEFLVRHRYDLRGTPGALEKLRMAAELVKQKLSYQSEVEMTIEELGHGPGGKALSLPFHLRRDHLERMVASIVDRTFEVCAEALTLARASAADFDEVLLVGGSTRMPLVRARVEEFFGKPVKANISPDEAVALGAAIQANALAGAERRKATLPLPPAAARRVPTIAGAGPGTLPVDGPRRPATLPGMPSMSGAAAPGPPSAPRAALVPESKQPSAPKQRESSAAFTLSEDEVEELLSPASPPLAAYSDDEITTRAPAPIGLARPELAPSPQRVPARRAELAASALVSEAPIQQTQPWELPSPAVPPSAGLGPARRSVPPAPPLLVDVTPLTLSVETVSGFCDTIIARNTQVPCEQTRRFVTASDGQAVVRIRVAQGESRKFAENTLLGEVELSDLPPLPRGEVQIGVTFALDSNGMLNVSATETRSGKATAVELRLVGLPDPKDVSAMTDRHAARRLM